MGSSFSRIVYKGADSVTAWCAFADVAAVVAGPRIQLPSAKQSGASRRKCIGSLVHRADHFASSIGRAKKSHIYMSRY